MVLGNGLAAPLLPSETSTTGNRRLV